MPLLLDQTDTAATDRKRRIPIIPMSILFAMNFQPTSFCSIIFCYLVLKIAPSL